MPSFLALNRKEEEEEEAKTKKGSRHTKATNLPFLPPGINLLDNDQFSMSFAKAFVSESFEVFFACIFARKINVSASPLSQSLVSTQWSYLQQPSENNPTFIRAIKRIG